MNIPLSIPTTCSESADNVKYLIGHPLDILTKPFTKHCEDWFQKMYPGYQAYMTTSCTKAMELIALSIGVTEADEIIMPSYSYVGVANSFANLNAKLVLLDIDPVTMNIAADQIGAAITPHTRAVVVMHYGGVACDMDKIANLCREKDIILIEDNAQGIGAKYHDKLLGSFGDFSCISFDSLKNITCGEGGVLLYKSKYKEAVEICSENGTNRHDFMAGKTSQYEWVAKGSKFAISEFNAAILHPLLLRCDDILLRRHQKWMELYNAISEEPILASLLTPRLLSYDHNAHIFFLKCSDEYERNQLMNHLNGQGISSSFHYTPLHKSLRGLELGFEMENDRFTSLESGKLLRLPIYIDLSSSEIQYITKILLDFFNAKSDQRHVADESNLNHSGVYSSPSHKR